MTSSTSVDPSEEILVEIRELQKHGFNPGYMLDLEVGDIFAGPRIFSCDGPRKLFVVDRIIEQEYLDTLYEGGASYSVMNVVVYDEEGLQRHLSYGGLHEIHK